MTNVWTENCRKTEEVLRNGRKDIRTCVMWIISLNTIKCRKQKRRKMYFQWKVRLIFSVPTGIFICWPDLEVFLWWIDSGMAMQLSAVCRFLRVTVPQWRRLLWPIWSRVVSIKVWEFVRKLLLLWLWEWLFMKVLGRNIIKEQTLPLLKINRQTYWDRCWHWAMNCLVWDLLWTQKLLIRMQWI